MSILKMDYIGTWTRFTKDSFQMDQLNCQIVALFKTKWICSKRVIQNGKYTFNPVNYHVFGKLINHQITESIYEEIQIKYRNYDEIEISAGKSRVEMRVSDKMAVLIHETSESIVTCEIHQIDEPWLGESSQNRVIPKLNLYSSKGYSPIELDQNGNLVEIIKNEIYAFIGSHFEFSGNLNIENMVYIVADSDKYYAISTSDWMNYEFEIKRLLLSGNKDVIVQGNVDSRLEIHASPKKFANPFELANYLKNWKQ
eukprot:NODE_47_length_32105_cov_1.240892.p15 type:complete len:255 gc:universal NODE_47_length_32105_cov_1.240892:13162-13926(+)